MPSGHIASKDVSRRGERFLIARGQIFDRVVGRFNRGVCAIENTHPVLAAKLGRNQVDFLEFAQLVSAPEEALDTFRVCLLYTSDAADE